MRKLIILGIAVFVMILLIGCVDEASSVEYKMNNHKKPLVMVSESDPYECGYHKALIKDGTGTVFTIYDKDICRNYNIGDTLQK